MVPKELKQRMGKHWENYEKNIPGEFANYRVALQAAVDAVFTEELNPDLSLTKGGADEPPSRARVRGVSLVATRQWGVTDPARSTRVCMCSHTHMSGPEIDADKLDGGGANSALKVSQTSAK